jgi:hypothetical protein
VAFNIFHKDILEGASAPSKIQEDLGGDVATGKRTWEGVFVEADAIDRAKRAKLGLGVND